MEKVHVWERRNEKSSLFDKKRKRSRRGNPSFSLKKCEKKKSCGCLQWVDLSFSLIEREKTLLIGDYFEFCYCRCCCCYSMLLFLLALLY